MVTNLQVEVRLASEDDALSPGKEAPLATALLRREPAAVDAFYRDHFEAVYAFVFHRAWGSREDAEDITQDTFVTALARLSSFTGRSSVRSWVLGIAKHKAWEQLRRRGRAQAKEDLARAFCQLETEDVSEEVLQSEQAAHLVQCTLALLPPHYRGALEDKYLRGLSLEAMAAREGRSPKAVESTIVRARRAFADTMRSLVRAEDES